MLLRERDGGVLAIGQPAHALVSGQLARAWGNERFGPVEPREAVCLAAEQHDVGWATRDLEALFNPDTGLPRSFMEMPLAEHLRIWTEGPRQLLAQSRYAALLVSMHGHRLYERRDLDRLPAEEAHAIRTFIDGRREFEAALRGLLADDPGGGEPALAQLDRNSLLIWTWDYLSLALCLNWPSATAKGCPTADGRVDLELHGPRAETDRWEISPWPFAAPAVTVRCEGRRLVGHFKDKAALRGALESAPWETLEIELGAS